MNKNSMIIAGIILIIAAAAVGFYAGMQYQTGRARNTFAQGGTFRQRFAGQFAQNGQNANFQAVRGQILSMSNNILTIKLSDGSTKIVVLSGNTTFAQSAKASLSDLKVGDTVNAIGTTNSDGSVTAQDLQINPLQQMRPAGTSGVTR